MKSKFALLIIFSVLIAVFSYCSSDVLSPEEGDTNVTAKIYQASKCLTNSTSSSSISSAYDSSFSYSFTDTLSVDILVEGNCCPDSNRYTSSYYISSDTIYATVTDTAQNLCRCICPYQIHFEFTGLTLDSYIFHSDGGYKEYNEIVHR